MQYVTGNTIKELRERKRMTQKELAEKLCVSDKTVSKWETGRGLPDISLLMDLAGALGISVPELLTGDCITNQNRASNMKKTAFYVCPVCGNIIHSMGEGAFSCCGISLPVLEAESPDEKHNISIENIDGMYSVSVKHEMTKNHYISFLALVSFDRIEMVKLYPEQNAECRFSKTRHGTLYACCNQHGLFKINI